MDSIRPDVWEYYESKNVKITKVDEQDSNDFMKCVYLLNEKEKENNETVREKLGFVTCSIIIIYLV